ncbi:MAG: DUF4276 family protein [Candidatus Hatepunaea meridiana]|nr:DUF4276 family protein [Candidatus Hatepunaea meridiana]
MKRLLIHVEGETEEDFVNEILSEHLYNFGYEKVSARLVGNARMRDRRGGIRGWNSVRKDILNHIKEDAGCLTTTMVDYYGLPKTGERAWPGREAAGRLSFRQKATTVQKALSEDIQRELGTDFKASRFIPYVMMHEFEGMLFSDCTRFAQGIYKPSLAKKFQEIRDVFNSPEEINDSPTTAPSKRVLSVIPGYEKPLLGILAILAIGLETIRSQCPNFRKWLECLEGLPKNYRN